MRRRGGWVPAWLCLLPAGTAAQAPPVQVEVGGYVQAQFRTSSAADVSNTFDLRRARPRIEVDLGNGIIGRLESDFSRGRAELRHGWIAVTLGGVTVHAGQFKMPFGRIVNTSSSGMAMLERGLRIDGLAEAYGDVANDLPTFGGEVLLGEEQYLLEAFGYQSYDVGAMVSGDLGRVHIEVGAFNGAGTAGEDADDGKTVSARVTLPIEAAAPLEVGAGMSHHAREVDGELERGTAFEVDLMIGELAEPGTGFLAEAALGDSFAGDATFRGIQGFVWHYRPVTSARVVAVEAAARLSWGDPDADHDTDAGLLVSPAFNLYLDERTRLMLGWDIYIPQDDRLDTGHAFTSRLQLYF